MDSAIEGLLSTDNIAIVVLVLYGVVVTYALHKVYRHYHEMIKTISKFAITLERIHMIIDIKNRQHD